MIYLIIGYLILGIATIVYMAYDAFSETFDFGLSDGWEFWWFQRYLIWIVVIIIFPYLLPREIFKKLSDRKYVKEWKTKGCFTRKL